MFGTSVQLQSFHTRHYVRYRNRIQSSRDVFSYEGNEGKSGNFGVKYGKMRDTDIKVNKH